MMINDFTVLSKDEEHTRLPKKFTNKTTKNTITQNENKTCLRIYYKNAQSRKFTDFCNTTV